MSKMHDTSVGVRGKSIGFSRFFSCTGTPSSGFIGKLLAGGIAGRAMSLFTVVVNFLHEKSFFLDAKRIQHQ